MRANSPGALCQPARHPPPNAAPRLDCDTPPPSTWPPAGGGRAHIGADPMPSPLHTLAPPGCQQFPFAWGCPNFQFESPRTLFLPQDQESQPPWPCPRDSCRLMLTTQKATRWRAGRHWGPREKSAAEAGGQDPDAWPLAPVGQVSPAHPA